MSGNDLNSASGYTDDVLDKLNLSIPENRWVSYLEVGKATGLHGRELDLALAELDRRKSIKSEHLPGGVYYRKVTPDTRQKWYTLDEAANYLRTSRRTLYQLIKEGQVAAYRLGRKGNRRFNVEDLDAVMQGELGQRSSALTE